MRFIAILCEEVHLVCWHRSIFQLDRAMSLDQPGRKPGFSPIVEALSVQLLQLVVPVTLEGQLGVLPEKEVVFKLHCGNDTLC